MGDPLYKGGPPGPLNHKQIKSYKVCSGTIGTTIGTGTYGAFTTTAGLEGGVKKEERHEGMHEVDAVQARLWLAAIDEPEYRPERLPRVLPRMKATHSHSSGYVCKKKPGLYNYKEVASHFYVLGDNGPVLTIVDPKCLPPELARLTPAAAAAQGRVQPHMQPFVDEIAAREKAEAEEAARLAEVARVAALTAEEREAEDEARRVAAAEHQKFLEDKARALEKAAKYGTPIPAEFQDDAAADAAESGDGEATKLTYVTQYAFCSRWGWNEGFGLIEKHQIAPHLDTIRELDRADAADEEAVAKVQAQVDEVVGRQRAIHDDAIAEEKARGDEEISSKTTFYTTDRVTKLEAEVMAEVKFLPAGIAKLRRRHRLADVKDQFMGHKYGMFGRLRGLPGAVFLMDASGACDEEGNYKPLKAHVSQYLNVVPNGSKYTFITYSSAQDIDVWSDTLKESVLSKGDIMYWLGNKAANASLKRQVVPALKRAMEVPDATEVFLLMTGLPDEDPEEIFAMVRERMAALKEQGREVAINCVTYNAPGRSPDDSLPTQDIARDLSHMTGGKYLNVRESIFKTFNTDRDIDKGIKYIDRVVWGQEEIDFDVAQKQMQIGSVMKQCLDDYITRTPPPVQIPNDELHAMLEKEIEAEIAELFKVWKVKYCDVPLKECIEKVQARMAKVAKEQGDTLRAVIETEEVPLHKIQGEVAGRKADREALRARHRAAIEEIKGALDLRLTYCSHKTTDPANMEMLQKKDPEKFLDGPLARTPPSSSTDRMFFKACVNGDVLSVQRLLMKGAKVNQANDTFLDTPLHVAVQREHFQIAQMLCDAGCALPGPKNSVGLTALDECRSMKMRNVLVNAIKARGVKLNATARKTLLGEGTQFGAFGQFSGDLIQL